MEIAVSLKDGLMQLLGVQDVDRELRALEEAKSQYPAEIAQRKDQIDRAEQALKDLTDQLADHERRQRFLEHELEALKQQLAKLEARFSEVTTNKEYDALQLEVEACKSKMSECEGQILEIIESTESILEQAEIEKQDTEEVRQEQQGIIDELQGKLDSLQGEVDGIESRRQDAVKGLDKTLLHNYELVRRSRGLSVAAVRKGACGGCYRQLPAQMKSIVRRSEEIIHCESCGAIFVWDDKSA
ncbi:MAG: C4-type zinc ribbon domain-containing protein [Candidatus Latescibacterota bacterium]|nr:C4-type zinc ribbon domain-containing protein [Candidatus Latescibacterota bacterium]